MVYTVKTSRGAWSHVVGEDGTLPDKAGPWRYRSEAQDYADELNSKSTPRQLASMGRDLVWPTIITVLLLGALANIWAVL